MLNFKIKGSCTIRIVDSRNGEVKEVREKENLIHNNFLINVLAFNPSAWLDSFVNFQSFETYIFISADTSISSASGSPSVMAVAYTPSGVTKKTFYPSANPIYGQLQQRIDYIGSSRTFQTVGLREGRTGQIMAYLLLDTPCVQGAYDYLDLFYRVQFINDGGQGFSNDALLDFAGQCFGARSFNMGYYAAWIGKASANSSPYKRYNSALSLLNSSGNQLGSLSGSAVNSHYKFKMTNAFGQNAAVGYIFGCIAQGYGTAGGYYTLKNVVNPNAPFQNIFTHSANATVPFFDSLTSAAGNGKIKTSGNWTGKFPELYKISMVNGGATGVATYKYSVRKHLGFNGNTYQDLAFNSPYRIDLPGFHGMKEENNDLLRWSNTQIVQYDSTGVMLLDVYDGSRHIWDATTTPALTATQIRQCAVDTANQKIYVACRTTGLWVIDVANGDAAHQFTSPCYGVDVGRNNVAYALIEGGLYKSSDWSTPLSFTYAGITDSNWSKVLFLKADPEHNEDRLCFTVTTAGQNNKLVWARFNYTPAATPAATRYWRVKSTNAGGGSGGWACYELVFRNAFLTDITTGGSASASHNGGNGAAAAFDKNVNSHWAANNTSPNVWLQYTFASNVVVYAVSVNHLNNLNSGGIYFPPTTFDVEYSPDNSTWITAWSFTTGTNLGVYYDSTAPYNPLAVITGAQSSSIKSYPASLDVSDTGSHWACGAGRLTFGSTSLGSLGGSLVTSNTYTHSIYGSDAYYKIAFYNSYLILADRIVDINGITINTFTNFTSGSGRSAILHLDSGITILSNFLRQMFTDNSYCWNNFGWDGSQWVLNHNEAKTTHAIDQLLGNGISIRFLDGANAPHFIGSDYFTQSICFGKHKDNSSEIKHNSCWFSVPVIFDRAVGSGVTVPATPTPPTAAQYWRIRTLNAASGSSAHFRVFELIFKDNSGADITTGGTASSSHNNATATNAFDKNNSTFYTSNQYVSAANITLQYTFVSAVSVSQVSLLLNRDTANVQPTQYAVESSNDNLIWSTVWSFDTGGNSSFTSTLSNYFITLTAANEADFRRIETDSKELHLLTLNGTPVTTVYTSNSDIYTAPGVNEVFISSNGKVYFNSANAGATLTGTYAYLKF